MFSDGMEYIQHDRVTVTMEWEQGIHAKTKEPLSIAMSSHQANAFFAEKEPSQVWGACIGKTIGGAKFSRPLLVIAASVLEVLEWELERDPVIDQQHVDELHRACLEIVKAYDDLDAHLSEGL